MKVAFTGPRLGMTDQQRSELYVQLHRLGATELHHGDCVGADQVAHDVARTMGLRIVGHPPLASGLRAHCQCDELRTPAFYLTRDRAMVLETELLLATPDGPPRRRSGTWYTVRFAQRSRVPGIIINPSGVLESWPQ